MEQETFKPRAFFRFEDLRVYDRSLDYIKFIHSITKGISANGPGELVKQFNQSAQSIAINIAEGSSRDRKQFVTHLKNSKTAIRECVVYTTLLNHLQLINDEQEEESRQNLRDMTKMIGALINSINRIDYDNRYNRDEQPWEEDEIDMNQ